MPSPLELITEARRAQAAETPAAPLQSLSNQQWRVRGTPIGETEAGFFKQREAQQAIRDRELQEMFSPAGLAGLGLGTGVGLASQTVGTPGDIRSIYEEYKPESFPNAPEFLKIFPTTEEIQEELSSKTGTPEYKAGIDIGNSIALAGAPKALANVAKIGAQTAGAVGKMIGKKINEAMLTGQGPLAHALAPVMPRRLDVYHGGSRFAPTPENPLGAFDPSKIGTGEGLQFGYGTYLTEAPDVGRGYVTRDMDYEAKLYKLYQQAEKRNDPFSLEILERAMMHKTPSELRTMYPPQAAGLISQIEKIPHSGALYKANLPDQLIPQMLDLDKPFLEQPHVVKALEAEGLNRDALNQIAQNIGTSGDSLYQYMARRLGGQKQASEYMRKIGIPGNVYLDPSQRDLGLNVRNFVVFPGEEKAVRIKQKLKSGGEVSMDAMRVAVWGKPDHKQFGGWAKGARSVEEAKRLYDIAKGTRAKAAQEAAGLYHPIGGGIKLSKPVELMQFETVKDPTVKGVQRKIITPQDLQGGIGIPLVGDRAAGGTLLTSVEGIPFRNPLTLEAGPDYMLTHTIPGSPESSIWRSGKGVISGLQSQVDFVKDMGRPIYGVNVVGAPTNVNYNTMVTEAILNQYDPTALTKKAKKEFLNDIRNYVPDPKKPHLKPGAVLTEADLNDVEALRAKMLAEGAGPLRKAFVERMALEPFQKMGFPDVPASRLATTEPSLVDVPTGSAGFTVGTIDPTNRALQQTPRGHKTYPIALAGEYFGSLENPVNYRNIFQDFSDKRRVFGKPEGSDWRSFSLSPQFQTFDQEWLDRLMQSTGANKPREWKKGGKVVKKADGGMTSDDLIVEERKL